MPGRRLLTAQRAVGTADVARADGRRLCDRFRCHEEGVTREEFLEVFSVGLVVGGSIVIPHLRRAMARLEELEG